MLVMFRFKNFGPFKEETVLDMRAVKSYKEHPHNLITECEDSTLLKVVSIYGANASGKSNCIEAYQYFSGLVRSSFARNDKEEAKSVLEEFYYPFLFDKQSVIDDTEFEAVYHLDDNEYRYGYVYNSERIRYEWLYKRALTSKRSSTIFERDGDKIILGNSIRRTCEKYNGDIDHDVLALSFFSSLRLKNPIFKNMVYCIMSILPIPIEFGEETDFFLRQYFTKDFDEKEKPKLLSFLHAIDVGIKDIDVEKNGNESVVYTYHIATDKSMCRVPLEIESAGTRRAIAIYSCIRIAILTGKGLIIDELNNQLHPLLQKYLVDLFYEESKCGQLIYTTHDATFLDKKYMRRDQIWFVSKNEAGESTLYSLADFKVRNDQSYAKDYLGGVYGGIPILKDFSFRGE